MAKNKFVKSAVKVQASKKGGLELVDIISVNPTKAQLIDAGIPVKHEPNYAPKRYPVSVLKDGVYEVTERSLKIFKRRFDAVFGREPQVGEDYEIVDTLMVQAKVINFLVGNKRGTHLVKFEYFPNDSGVRFQEKSWWDIEIEKMNLQGYSREFRGEAMKVWVNNKVTWTEEETEAFDIQVPESTFDYDFKSGGVGNFKHLLSFIKAYAGAYNSLLEVDGKEVGINSQDLDILDTLGGEGGMDNLLNTLPEESNAEDRSGIEGIEDIINYIKETYKEKERGVIIALGLKFRPNPKGDGMFSNQTNGLKFWSMKKSVKGEIQIPSVKPKMLAGNLMGKRGVYCVYPMEFPAVEFTSANYQELEFTYSNRFNNGKNTASAGVSTDTESDDDSLLEEGEEADY